MRKIAMQAVGGEFEEAKTKEDKLMMRSPSMKKLETDGGCYVFCFGSNNP
jgi:hypothetical protein